MTDKELKARVYHWQRVLAHLGVGHWRVESVKVLKDLRGGVRASVHKSGLYDECAFEFRRDHVRNAPLSEIDEDIVHEWLHVAMRDFDEALTPVEAWMPAATHNDWNERVDHEREGLVERLARLIVQLHGEAGTVPTA